MNLNRKNKIDFLKGLINGTASVLDIFSGDGFFIKAGGFYVNESIRYTEEQYQKIRESFHKRGEKISLFIIGDGEIMKAFILKNTKPFTNERSY